MAWLTSPALLVLLLAAASHVEASGSFEDFDGGKTKISSEELAKYFSEKQVVAGDDVDKCSDRVFEFRKRVQENGGPTVGVEPTVGLGAALLIFLLVGTFAAGIAQGFQMVRLLLMYFYEINLLIAMLKIFRSGNTCTTTLTTLTRLSTQAVRSASDSLRQQLFPNGPGLQHCCSHPLSRARYVHGL